jgi:toxin ParE1/3/4
MRVFLTRAAPFDLAAIRTHIGRHNPSAASRIAVRLVAACDSLEHLPERGRPGLAPATRELVAIRPYVIVCRLRDDTVRVLRIWHGAQARL